MTDGVSYSQVAASVWRLSPGGSLLTAANESSATRFAELERDAIYFYAELGTPTQMKQDPETAEKVYRALASVGLSEGQMILAVNRMQQAGIFFRESTV